MVTRWLKCSHLGEPMGCCLFNVLNVDIKTQLLVIVDTVGAYRRF